MFLCTSTLRVNRWKFMTVLGIPTFVSIIHSSNKNGKRHAYKFSSNAKCVELFGWRSIGPGTRTRTRKRTGTGTKAYKFLSHSTHRHGTK